VQNKDIHSYAITEKQDVIKEHAASD